MPIDPASADNEIRRLTGELERERVESAHQRTEAQRWRTVAFALAGRIHELHDLSQRSVLKRDDEAFELLRRSATEGIRGGRTDA